MNKDSTKHVLIVTEDGDLHAEAVAATLRRRFGVQAAFWDLRITPLLRCAINISPNLVKASASFPFGAELRDAGCIWWRRPGRAVVSASMDPAMDRFRADEQDALTHGLLYSCDATWVNDPGREKIAKEKIVQLTAASACGLHVPETLVTNDPEEAAMFIERLGNNAVAKRVSATPGTFTQTRLLTGRDRGHLRSLRSCPTILQQYVEAAADIRLIWMDGDIRCVLINSQQGAGWLDSRLDLAVRFVPHSLPANVMHNLDILMRRLGLIFGVVDLRLDKEGRYWFLEVNPQGQFAYLEIKSQVPFIEPFAGFLASLLERDRPLRRLTSV